MPSICVLRRDACKPGFRHDTQKSILWLADVLRLFKYPGILFCKLLLMRVFALKLPISLENSAVSQVAVEAAWEL